MTEKKRHNLLSAIYLLDFGSKPINELILQRGWEAPPEFERIGAVYDFVRDEIRFGYNTQDDIRASQVPRDGHGQCNTKAILLMALLRRLRIPCRLHGFIIHKALQRGVVPEIFYRFAPDDILHSWVEVRFDERWINLEGFIIDRTFLRSIQDRYTAETNDFGGYGIGTQNLADPPIDWAGRDTYVQNTGINRDLGVSDDPDSFYVRHSQRISSAKALLYRRLVRHLMNQRVHAIRSGDIPAIPISHAVLRHSPLLVHREVKS